MEARIRVVVATKTMGTEEDTATKGTTTNTRTTRGTMEDIVVDVAMMNGAEAGDKSVPMATPRVAVGALPPHPTQQLWGAKTRRKGILGQRHPVEPEPLLSQF